MNPHNNHSPHLVDPNRKRCPICNQSVYCRAGIHPQCAMKQADRPKPPISAPVDMPLNVPAPPTSAKARAKSA